MDLLLTCQLAKINLLLQFLVHISTNGKPVKGKNSASPFSYARNQAGCLNLNLCHQKRGPENFPGPHCHFGLTPYKEVLAVHPPSPPPQPRGASGGLRISRRHDTDCLTYRCFLPDLTGFASACCVGSNPPVRPPFPTALRPSARGFNPA